jgi:8-oxo-dGTP pyrophosphatase MutT (NUDIX family)
MLKQMTRQEKEWLRTESFETLWRRVWGNNALSSQYRSEEVLSKDKYLSLYSGVYTPHVKHHLCRSKEGHTIEPPPGLSSRFLYSLHTLLDESDYENTWEEPEWGFPKGRRNYHETDFDCARREFFEETGISLEHLHHIDNILPFEEIFMGSNYKSYKHKYYLMCLKDACMEEQYPHFQKTEVSKMEWKTYDECMACIRSYNLEKKRMLTKIHTCLTQYQLCII